MLTEKQRQELVKLKVCVNAAREDKKAREGCGDFPQGLLLIWSLS
jgi:hypothetical protein